MKLFRIAVAAVLLAANCLDLFAAEATNAAPKKLPRQPWHLADVWWSFESATPHFDSLDLDVTIDRDVPETVNLYIAPCGLGELSGIKFYGGLQSNINGWQSRTNPTRVHLGRGGIFSRWGKGKLSVAQARGAEDSHYEAAGYEGDFVSVRRPFAWTKGSYTWSLRAADTEHANGTNYTWVSCFHHRARHGRDTLHRQPALRGRGPDVLEQARGVRGGLLDSEDSQERNPRSEGDVRLSASERPAA